MITINEVLGWFGSFMLLLAYFMLIHKNLSSRSKVYQWMNVIGSLLLASYTFSVKSYPAFTTNFAWFLIALYGLFHASKKINKK